jgi:N-methylhydantoinase A
MTVHVAIDIGGTFTDVVARTDDRVATTKVPTTPADLVAGVRSGIGEILADLPADRADVDRFAHGTTAGTNAILERTGGTVGLLMTAGFRDVLAIGRQKREEMYDLSIDPQTPTFLAPRERRVEVPERIDETGTVLEPLDEDAVRAAVDRLVESEGIDSLGICYLHSFTNPEHERRTAEIVAECRPELYVSRSSAVNPKFREYERLVVTAFDAYLRPVIDGYVRRLTGLLDEAGIDAELEIMQSRGGLTTADVVLDRPVGTVLSGPAAAVAGAAEVGGRAGYDDLVTIDMGGTSSDVSLVRNGSPHVSDEGEIDGYPLRTPMVDVNTVGSGGGSVAWLDEADSLHVGPRSAGADPGPACYGRGGTEPTVTDASVVLGYLNPDYFADGALDLDADAARRAIRERVAEPLGYGVPEAARGIHSIVTTRLAEQLRLTTVKRGHDPREFVLFPMGGAGPVYAADLAATLDVPRVVVPRTPGVLSAGGLLAADVEHDHETTHVRRLDRTDAAALAEAYADLEARGRAATARAGGDPDAATLVRQADMRYHGQSFEIEVELPAGPAALTDDALEAVRESFHRRHEQVYGHRDESAAVEFVTLRTVYTYSPPGTATPPARTGESLADARKGTREVRFVDEGGPRETAVYERAELPAGVDVEGPAIVEQSDTTTVVPPAASCRTDDRGTLLVDPPS